MSDFKDLYYQYTGTDHPSFDGIGFAKFVFDRLTAEADALRRERDELAARLAEMDRELGVHRLYARALCRAVDAATDFAGTVGGGSSWWEEVWAYHAAEMDRTRPAPAAAPERAEPELCGCTETCGKEWALSAVACRKLPGRAKPCRCGPGGCSDSTSCPRGER